MTDQPEQAPEPHRPFLASQDDLKGVYANAARVSASAFEFTIDFLRVDHSEPTAPIILVARVALSHLCAGQLSDILEGQWKAYAAHSFPPEVTDVLSTGQGGGDPDVPDGQQPTDGDNTGP